MFKFEFKTTVIVAIFAALASFSFIGNSDAFEILSMYPSHGGYEDYTGYLYHSTYVKTSEPYYAVSWYINGVYVGFSGGGSGQTEAYFSPNTSDYPGSFQGEYYNIEAVASRQSRLNVCIYFFDFLAY